MTSTWLTSEAWWCIRRGLALSSIFLDQVILLKITAKLVVIDALLELDQDVVELHIELSALFEQHREIVLHNDRFVDLLEELVLCGVVANLSNGSIHTRGVLLNGLAESLLLLLESVILSKMGDILLFELFKYGCLISGL